MKKIKKINHSKRLTIERGESSHLFISNITTAHKWGADDTQQRRKTEPQEHLETRIIPARGGKRLRRSYLSLWMEIWWKKISQIQFANSLQPGGHSKKRTSNKRELPFTQIPIEPLGPRQPVAGEHTFSTLIDNNRWG